MTGVTEMTISVRVLTVDGTRRMSHRFYDQIPRRPILDDVGTILEPGADLWGWVNLCDGACLRNVDTCIVIVWAAEDRLFVAHHRAVGFRVEDFNLRDAIEELRRELPQLYLGG
jgi:hypothetical protein